jgi:hypothetical protein
MSFTVTITSIQTIDLLCGDGFMDFIHRPKGEILKIN